MTINFFSPKTKKKIIIIIVKIYKFKLFFKGFSEAKELWLPVHQNYKTLNLAKQKEDPVSHYKLYQKLTSLKKSSEVLKIGSLSTEILNSGDVLSIVRKLKDKSVMLLINFQDEKTQVVDVSNHTFNGGNVTVYISSVGSNIQWK